MVDKKNKTSLFIRIFLGILAISFFSNFILAYLLYSGYERAISHVRPLLSPEIFRDVEVSIFTTWIIVVSSLFFLMVMVSLLAVLFSSRLVKPIKKLVEAAREVGRGNLGVEVKPQTRDEIGELTEEFNVMIKELKAAKEALESERTVLEIKVKARTRQLEELAQGLDERVKEKTKELQERVAELEKFHKLTVGRELKMIELKEELEKLKKDNQKLKGRK